MQRPSVAAGAAILRVVLLVDPLREKEQSTGKKARVLEQAASTDPVSDRLLIFLETLDIKGSQKT